MLYHSNFFPVPVSEYAFGGHVYYHRLSGDCLRKLQLLEETLAIVVMDLSVLWPLRVIETWRGQNRQNALHHAGKSQVMFPHSRHNDQPAKAVDLVPLPIDWQDRDRFMAFAGAFSAVAARRQCPIRWGGDWNGNGFCDAVREDDLVHFELRPFGVGEFES